MGFSSANLDKVALLAAAAAHVAADKPHHVDLESYQEGDLGDIPTQEFHSSNIKASIYQINYWDADKIDTDTPYMFTTGKTGKWGPAIYSSEDLSLIWADNNYNGLAQAARTWENWRGHKRVMSTYSDGLVCVYDQSYKQIYMFDGRGDLEGVVPDSHEAMLTDDGNILMFLCPVHDADLTKVGGPSDGKISDCTIQEIEPDSGEVLFQWATSDYFRPEDSVWPFSNEKVWDYCHMNAVEKTEEGNYLVSYRHLSTVIMIDGKTKEVLWVMWGKLNMFTDVTEGNNTAHFAFQHDARVSGKNRVTLFDNHQAAHNGFCEDQGGPCSRGLEVEYDPAKKTVWVLNEWWHPQSLVSASRGSTQRTPNGNVVVAWGQNPMYTEYDPDGELVMDVQRGRVRDIKHGIVGVNSYRIWKGDWEGNPPWGPNIACDPDDTGRSVYVSWNGATKVDTWVMLMSDNMIDLNGAEKVVAQSPRNGFETRFKLDHYLDYVRIAALDSQGNIIGTTPAVDTRSRETIVLDYDVTEVTRAGAKIISGVPSSVSLSMPTGTTGKGPFHESLKTAEDSSVAGTSPPHEPINIADRSTVFGNILSGSLICFIMAVGLTFYTRQRKASKMRQASGFTPEASHDC